MWIPLPFSPGIPTLAEKISSQCYLHSSPSSHILSKAFALRPARTSLSRSGYFSISKSKSRLEPQAVLVDVAVAKLMPGEASQHSKSSECICLKPATSTRAKRSIVSCKKRPIVGKGQVKSTLQTLSRIPLNNENQDPGIFPFRSPTSFRQSGSDLIGLNTHPQQH